MPRTRLLSTPDGPRLTQARPTRPVRRKLKPPSNVSDVREQVMQFLAANPEYAPQNDAEKALTAELHGVFRAPSAPGVKATPRKQSAAATQGPAVNNDGRIRDARTKKADYPTAVAI